MSGQFARLFQNSSEGDASAPVIGSLPTWIKDKDIVVIYDGPVGMWDFEHESANHFFDGLAILTSFRIEDSGTMVKMSKRFLKSDAYEKAVANGKVIITEYATAGASDPDKSAISRMVSSIIPGSFTI